jgi:hypothetical protein
MERMHMDQACLDTLKRWFDGYIKPYCETDPEGLKNILIKVEHTRKVCDVMDLITAGEGLSAEDARLAGAVALLHDVGRFPQYQRWRTFRDSISDNHARLAVEVIRQQSLLDGLPAAERLLIEEAVRFHNLLKVPARLKSPTDLFLRLIRDADKLDIWRVFLAFFTIPEHERASAALLGFPDLPEVSPACLAALSAGQVVNLDTVACANDFKLLLISWSFDLTFGSSYRLVQRNDYLQALEANLPVRDDIRAAIAAARAHVDRHAGISS